MSNVEVRKLRGSIRCALETSLIDDRHARARETKRETCHNASQFDWLLASRNHSYDLGLSVLWTKDARGAIKQRGKRASERTSCAQPRRRLPDLALINKNT